MYLALSFFLMGMKNQHLFHVQYKWFIWIISLDSLNNPVKILLFQMNKHSKFEVSNFPSFPMLLNEKYEFALRKFDYNLHY
jgi:hypothetical protein